jgi:hypothetical protein
VVAYTDSIFGDVGATLPGSSAKVVVEEQEVPRAYALSQNYPNPFNPETTIGYDLPEMAYVRLKVYDLSGRIVRSLSRGVRQPGRYRAVWDGRDEKSREVASGIYFYRLEVMDRGVVETRRMLLVR